MPTDSLPTDDLYGAQLAIDSRFGLGDWLIAAAQNQTPDGIAAIVFRRRLYQADSFIICGWRPSGPEFIRTYLAGESKMHHRKEIRNGYAPDEKGCMIRYAGFAANSVAVAYERCQAVPELGIAERHTVYVYGRDEDVAKVIQDSKPRPPAAEAKGSHLTRIAAAMDTIATLAGDKTLVWEDLIPRCESVMRAVAGLQSGVVLIYADPREDVAGAAYLVDGDPVLFNLLSTGEDGDVIEIRNLYNNRQMRTFVTHTTAGTIDGTDVLTVSVESVGATVIRPSRVITTAASVWIAYVHALARLESPREIDIVELDRLRDMALKAVAF